MSVMIAQIAPQRSTQYAALASALAPQELLLSPVGVLVRALEPLRLGGQDYLRAELEADLTEGLRRELGQLALTSAFFYCHEGLGGIRGPLLQPIEHGFQPALPRALLTTRRYRGKTNELFTHFMCNVARFGSGFAREPWDTLRVFDPLAGGGTTLFSALVLGADAAGVEHNPRDVESTVTYLHKFMRAEGIPCREKKERLRQVGQRWTFDIGRSRTQRCLLCRGETARSDELLEGFKPHLIVGDLPYGIQHRGALQELLTQALPVWASLLPAEGAMVLAWESTRFSRADMVALIEAVAPLTVLQQPPYDRLAHRVDRVIKRRDVVVARPSGDGATGVVTQ